MTLGQGLRHPIDETLILKQGVDSAEGGIPKLVAVRQEHFDEAAWLYARRTMAPPVRPVCLRGCTA
jgi:hypothetical protein